MFGKESAGIPEEILKANPDTCVRIPMIGEDKVAEPFQFCCDCFV